MEVHQYNYLVKRQSESDVYFLPWCFQIPYHFQVGIQALLDVELKI